MPDGLQGIGIKLVLCRLVLFLECLWQAAWPSLLTTGDARARRRAGRVLTSGNDEREVGGRLRILVDVPGPIVSEGFRSTGSAVRSKFSGSEASMTLTVDSVREGEEVLEWHITW